MTQENYYSSSEAVTSGHPDRLADNIAAIIINDIQAKDGPNSHAAIEVFITHDSVIIGGEATTTLNINDKYLTEAVQKGFDRSGYIDELRNYWSKDECLIASDMYIVNKICAQSPDIALGTTDKGDESGWNDQGVYFSSADNSNATMQGMPQYLATLIGEKLQVASKLSILNGGRDTAGLILGPDIKVVVTCKTLPDGFTPLEVTAITVAQSHSADTDVETLRTYVQNVCYSAVQENGLTISTDCQWTINGTGRFVVCGPISDTSMTGRKISVNHPSAGPAWCNKMIGGGSLVKPWHASDLILNVASRFVANVIVRSGLSSYAVVGCAGAIGTKGLQSIFIKGDNSFEANDKTLVYKFFAEKLDWSPKGLANLFGFFGESFDFGKLVDANFFGHPDVQPWEDTKLIDTYANRLATIWSNKVSC